MTLPVELPESRWPHRLSLLLAFSTFPLIWIGGLVTSTDAGMAVPDWPNTYGYNLFLYPWQSWLYGPWDLFIEHGHRLVASLVGLIAIVLVVVSWKFESRRSVCWFSVLLLLGVIGQGVLGGMRVRLDERQLALVHGCVGPLFFALATAMAVVTSPRWKRVGWGSERRSMITSQQGGEERQSMALPCDRSRQVFAVAVMLLIGFYLQLVFGAMLRHVPVDGDPLGFRHTALSHVGLAGLLVFAGTIFAGWAMVRLRSQKGLRGPAILIGMFVWVQVALGVATWTVKYGWPTFVPGGAEVPLVVSAGSAMQALITTGHVATGSLLIAMATILLMRAGRQLSWNFSHDWTPGWVGEVAAP